MRLHNITITPKHVTIDGQKLIIHKDGPHIEQPVPGLSIVHIPVFASTVTVSGDTHDPDEPTPIYDQLIAETKARTAAHKIRQARAQHVAAAIRKDKA